MSNEREINYRDWVRKKGIFNFLINVLIIISHINVAAALSIVIAGVLVLIFLIIFVVVRRRKLGMAPSQYKMSMIMTVHISQMFRHSLFICR